MSYLERTRIQWSVFAVLFLLSLVSIVLAFRSGGFTAGLATSVATFSLVVITAWYVAFTERILDATRATIAPELYVEFAVTNDGIPLGIENRGEGTATNVEIRITVQSGGREYTYQLPIAQPIRESGEVILSRDEQINPAFRVSAADIRTHGNRDIEFYMADEESAAVRVLPLLDLLTLFADTERPIFRLTVTYADANETTTYEEPVAVDYRLDPTADTLTGAIVEPSEDQSTAEYVDDPVLPAAAT